MFFLLLTFPLKAYLLFLEEKKKKERKTDLEKTSFILQMTELPLFKSNLA